MCQSTRHPAETNVQVASVGNPVDVEDILAQHTEDREDVPAPNKVQDNPVQHAAEQLGTHTTVCDLGDDHMTSISSKDAVEHNLIQSASTEVHRCNLTHAGTATDDGECSGANNDGKLSNLTYDEENCRPDIQMSENHTKSAEYLNDLQKAGNSASIDDTEIPRNAVSSEAYGDDNELKNNPLNDVESSHLIDGQLQYDMNNNLSVPKASCLYKCCSACFRAVYKMVHDTLSNSLRPNQHCLTVDDMHDILSAWCMNLLATVRKCYSSQDEVSCKENFETMHNKESCLEHCACQSNFRHLSMECICHLENNETGTANTDCLSGQSLSFFNKDGVWMPSNFTAETELHCSFRRFCICSILGTISMLSQFSS